MQRHSSAIQTLVVSVLSIITLMYTYNPNYHFCHHTWTAATVVDSGIFSPLLTKDHSHEIGHICLQVGCHLISYHVPFRSYLRRLSDLDPSVHPKLGTLHFRSSFLSSVTIFSHFIFCKTKNRFSHNSCFH